MSDTATLEELVSAYIKCSEKSGSARAELTLMFFLPKDKPDGKCHDVAEKDRRACINQLKKAAKIK